MKTFGNARPAAQGSRYRKRLWRSLYADSRSREMVVAALAVTVIAGIAKVCGAAKELLVAYRLGTHAELGAFLFAYLFPAFLINIATASLQVALVPRYLDVKARQGTVNARSLASGVTSICFLGLCGVAVLLAPVFIALVPHVARSFDPATLRLCQLFILLLMPLLPLNGVGSLWTGILNAEGRYRLGVAVPVITPIVVGLCLTVLWTQFGVFALVYGTLGGAIVETLLLGWVVRRVVGPPFGPLRLHGVEEGNILRTAIPLIGANLLMAGSMFVEQSFAASVSSTAVAVYSFGTRLTSVGAAVLITTLSTILLPRFSRIVAENGPGALIQATKRVVPAVLLITIPLAAVLGLASVPITSALFQHGSFTASDTQLVATVQKIHSLYIPIFAIGMVGVRLINAIQKSRIILIGSAANLGACMLLNGVLTPHFGVVGIAWANVGMYVTSAIVLWTYLIRTLHAYSSSEAEGAK